MKYVCLFALAALLPVQASAAPWQSIIDEDPMTDEKVAIVATTEDGFSIGLKCWEGKPDSTMLMFMTPLPWDATADYKPVQELTVRVDKGERREMFAKPSETGGQFSLVTAEGAQPGVLEFAGEIGAAKQRIAVSLGDKVMTFPAKGSSAAIKKFAAACKLTLPVATEATPDAASAAKP